MKKRTASIVAVLVVAVGLLVGCGDDDDDDDDGGPGLPNPASAFCEEQGGTVEIERDDDGSERGICVLPDGSRVDEWDYYRSESPDADDG